MRRFLCGVLIGMVPGALVGAFSSPSKALPDHARVISFRHVDHDDSLYIATMNDLQEVYLNTDRIAQDRVMKYEGGIVFTPVRLGR